ncbi:MAG: DapH/DapD/GlmU-related protein [Bradyrhizobium sp.]|uniref:DapH/DapD/GlmU-related protein n=1 Tax=Bradyrhizobium sp. TaxID=376 RepID=UPI0029A36D4E|nr:DapH/DapD/GlmU-related protein [Bradyrhizobium sp.]MDX3971158.1 DapH/DapD/GlmU-related protein [Bradyrhizobium sp.]
MTAVHAKAHVEAGVSIGAGTSVWQFASVIRGATIGADCSVGGCAIVDAAIVGDRCLIGHGAQLHPGTRLCNDVFVGPGVIACNDRWPRVGKDGFDAGALLDRRLLTVLISDGVSIGAGAIILPGVLIGANSVVAAGAVVTHSMPPCSLWKRKGGWVPLSARRPLRLREAGSEGSRATCRDLPLAAE